jgi:hypothetical protein
MSWLVVVLSVAVLGLAALAVVTSRRLRNQTELTAVAERNLAERTEELRTANEALGQAREQRSAAEEETRVATAGRAAAEEAARTAEGRAASAMAEVDSARSERAEARAEADRAVVERDEARVEAARANEALLADEQRAGGDEAAEVPVAVPGGNNVDAAFLWALERVRSERTWRQSVALSPDDESVLDTAENPLIEAIRVDLEAAREEVGVVVDLDADLPRTPTAAGSLLALRAAQELLATVVRRSESSVVHVRADGDDVIITVDAVDEQGESVAPGPLDGSPSVSAVDGGVRIHGAMQL